MHCTSCSMRIDGDLEEISGVKSSVTNFARGIADIEYDENKVQIETLKDVIQQAGYTVEQ